MTAAWRFFFCELLFCNFYVGNFPWIQRLLPNPLSFLAIRQLVIIFLLVLLPFVGYAVEPSEMLRDPSLELRARSISVKLRCLVCQNQSIDESDAVLARDLRILVRERLVAGDSDNEIIKYVVSRYGDFVLLIPPFKPITYVLWLSPLIILAVAFLGIVIFFRNRKNPSIGEKEMLSADEKSRLGELMSDSFE